MASYCCNIGECTKCFSKLSELTAHIDSAHGRDQKYICTVCGRLFNTKEALYTHRTSAHPKAPTDLPYSCPYCSKKFETKAQVDAHVSSAHTITTYTCKYCCKKFSSKEALAAHMVAEHTTAPPTTYRCSYCGLTFATKEELALHESAKHGDSGSPPEDNPDEPDEHAPRPPDDEDDTPPAPSDPPDGGRPPSEEPEEGIDKGKIAAIVLMAVAATVVIFLVFTK